MSKVASQVWTRGKAVDREPLSPKGLSRATVRMEGMFGGMGTMLRNRRAQLGYARINGFSSPYLCGMDGIPGALPARMQPQMVLEQE